MEAFNWIFTKGNSVITIWRSSRTAMLGDIVYLSPDFYRTQDRLHFKTAMAYMLRAMNV